jgi:cysteinyl-tRNA synthetase
LAKDALRPTGAQPTVGAGTVEWTMGQGETLLQRRLGRRELLRAGSAGALGLAALGAGASLPGQPWTSRVAAAPTGALQGVAQWFYFISPNLRLDIVEQIRNSTYDLVVLDFIPSESNNARYPMADVVWQLRNAPRPKRVVAYIDIGQAESHRTYWRQGWRVGNPRWIVATDPDGWRGNYPVAFWNPEWREIWLGDNGYLARIIEAGFDGVYLDWVEAYSDDDVAEAARRDRVDPRERMIAWVGDIARFTRGRRPEFLVIPQNAAELVDNDEYVAMVDAIAQEQTWFDGAADNDPPGDCPLPRTRAEVDTPAYRNSLPPACAKVYNNGDSPLHVSSEEYVDHLTRWRDKGKPVLTVDYAVRPENVTWVYMTSRALGFIPFVTSRALDRWIPPVP